MRAQKPIRGFRHLPVIAALALLCATSLSAGVNRWTSQGPWTGLITAVAVDPTDPQTVYVAAQNDGIFRTRDGGATWQGVNQGLRSFFIYSLVLDPLQPSTLYAGAQYAFVSKSLDRGDHWESQFIATHDNAYESVYQLAVDPVHFGTVYAATNDGVWKTTDGGCSWYESNNGLPSQLTAQTIVVDPTDPSVLYLGTYHQHAFKSTDGGDSWTPSTAGLLYMDVNGFAVDPRDPNTVYATQSYFVDVDPPQSGGAVFKSSDGGANWSVLADLPNLPYVSVVVLPYDHAVVFATSGDGGVFRSVDSGATWSASSIGIPGLPSVNPIAASPTPGTLWAGTPGTGVYESIDSGDHWQDATRGVAGCFTSALVIDPGNDTMLWASNLWGLGGGVFKTVDSGLTWSLSSTGLGTNRVLGLAVVPVQPPVLYAALDFHDGVYRSADGGANWSPTSDIPNDGLLSGVVVPPLDPSKVYVEALDDLYVSDDAGASWAPAGPSPHYARVLLPDETDPATFFGVVDEHVQKSVDGAATWNPLENGIEGAAVVALAQSPADPQLLMAGAQGDAFNGFAAIYRSTDGGANWAPAAGIDPSYQINSIAFDPTDPSRVYGAASPVTIFPAPPVHGAFRSLDSGATWEPYDAGLQSLPLDNAGALRVAIASDGSLLHLGTPGGVFELAPSATAAPAIGAVSPGSGNASGGTPITITGSGFDPSAVVAVGALPALNVQVVDGGQILATTPAGSPGVVSVTVTNADAQFSTLGLAFLYDFSDVPPESLYHDWVAALALRGISAGCGSGHFCPDNGLTRAQAAVQIEKALHGADFWFPPASDTFLDLDRCSGTAEYIYQLSAEGITAGCGAFVFCPSDALTRAQVAVLLLRAEHGGDYVPPPATGTVFSDVPVDAFAADFIEQFAAEGVTAGCGGGNYCPDRTVTRAEAAVMIGRTLPEAP